MLLPVRDELIQQRKDTSKILKDADTVATRVADLEVAAGVVENVELNKKSKFYEQDEKLAKFNLDLKERMTARADEEKSRIVHELQDGGIAHSEHQQICLLWNEWGRNSICCGFEKTHSTQNRKI